MEEKGTGGRNMSLELVSQYEGRVVKEPKLSFGRKYVLGFTPYLYNNVDVEKALREVESLLKSLPQQKYQLLILNTRIPYLTLPRTQNEKKNKLIELAEKELNQKVSFRKLGFYLCFDEKKEVVKSLLSSCFSEVRDAREELFSQLAFLFGGVKEEPFFYPLKRTEEGFEIVGKEEGRFASVVFEHKAPLRVLQFGIAHVLANLPRDFLYVLSFYRPSPSEYEGLLEKLQKRYAEKGTTAGEEVVAELNRVITDIANERELLFFYSSVLVLFGDDRGKLEQEVTELLSRISSNTYLQFATEKDSGLTVFKSAFVFKDKDVSKLRSMKLLRRITLSSFSYLFPVLKHFTGRKDRKGVPYLNASGEPVFVWWHDSTAHQLTLGSTGSGKSVDVTWGSLFEDCTAFIEYIQEDTGSFKPFVLLTEGEDAYFPISFDRPVSVNPFGKHIYKLSADSLCKLLSVDYRIFDEPDVVSLETALSTFLKEDEKVREVTITKEELERVFEEQNVSPLVKELILEKDFDGVTLPLQFDRDKQSFVVAILQTMVEGQFGITREEVNYISKLVARVYEDHDGKRELTVNDFYEVARKEKGEVAQKVADGLFPFTSKGEFAGFFDRPTDLNRPFKTLFIELRTLKLEVLNPVMLSLLKHLLTLFSSPAYQKFTRRVVIDEGWTVFKNPLLKDFLESALRTFRKKGIAINFASQSVDEASSFLVGQTEVRYFKFFDDKEVLRKFSFLTEDDVEEIVRIKKPRDYGNKYSVSFVESKSFGKGLLYLVLPDFFYWVSTTRQEDKVKRHRAYNEHKDLLKAILHLAREGR